MAFISLTRLRIRSLRYMPAFAVVALKSVAQARKAPGNLGVRLRRTRGLTFWTFTAWENPQAMSAYRSAAPHRDAMPKLRQWCDEASVANWSQTSDTLPDWDHATARMGECGRLSKVANPSTIQAGGQINLT